MQLDKWILFSFSYGVKFYIDVLGSAMLNKILSNGNG